MEPAIAPSAPDSRKVFVVHGRNEPARKALFEFLRALGLEPIEWSQAIAMTGAGTPYVGQVLEVALAAAQAIVVLQTPDEVAYLHPRLAALGDQECEPMMQARPNVLFEAGMAIGISEARTVIVEMGKVRAFSDVQGRHVVRMDGTMAMRQELASRLRTVGCDVNISGSDWHTAGDLTPPPDGGLPLGHRLPSMKAQTTPRLDARLFSHNGGSDNVHITNHGPGDVYELNVDADSDTDLILHATELPVAKLPVGKSIKLIRAKHMGSKSYFTFKVKGRTVDGSEFEQELEAEAARRKVASLIEVLAGKRTLILSLSVIALAAYISLSQLLQLRVTPPPTPPPVPSATPTSASGGTSTLTTAAPTPASQVVPDAIMKPDDILTYIKDHGPNIADPLTHEGGWAWQPGTGCGFVSGANGGSAAYHVKVAQPDGPSGGLQECFAGNIPSRRNFIFQVQMNIEMGSSGGLVFRAAKRDQTSPMYRVLLSIRKSYDISLGTPQPCHRTPDPIPSNSTYCQSPDAIAGVGQPNILTVAAQGDHVDLFINKKFTDYATSRLSDSGYFGVFAHWQDGVSGSSPDLAFSDLKIWYLPTP